MASVSFPKELEDDLRLIAGLEGCSLSDLVTRAWVEHLEANKEEFKQRLIERAKTLGNPKS